MSTYIITSAPPNPNGDLHLGHLSGPFLGADVLSRHLRQRGHEVRYVGYSDEHSCYVPRRAAELGITPHEAALRFGNQMSETLSLGAMHHDWFTRPLTTPRHTEIVQRFFTRLWEDAKLEVRRLPVFYCADCKRHLYEAEVRGACQFCAEPSDGVYCEACGLAQDSAGLISAHCTACGSTPETRTMERIVFPLENYRDQLLAYYSRAQQQRPWRPRLRAYLDTLFKRELPTTPISRQADYGIPVPLDDWSGHILDTWFSGIFGYVAATACLTEAEGRPELWEVQWQDPDTEIVNFIGFDCSFSHAVLWPALLLAHGGMTLPSQVVTNEFYRLEGDKFSTSRGHAIWGGEFLRQVAPDALRFHLCLTGPELEQNNFTLEEFADTLRTLLVESLETWSHDVLRLLEEDFDSTVPKVGTMAGPLAGEIAVLCERVGLSLSPQSFSPSQAAAALADVVHRAVGDLPRLESLRRKVDDEQAQAREDYARALFTHVQALGAVVVTAAPLMPGWSGAWAKTLGLPVDPATRLPRWPASADEPPVPTGIRTAAAPAPFFHTLR